MKTLIALVFLSVSLYSCQKVATDPHRQNNQKCRLVRMVQGLPGSDSSFTFQYSDSGVLMSYVKETTRDTVALEYYEGNVIAMRNRDKSLEHGYIYNAAAKLTYILYRFDRTQLIWDNDTILNGANIFFRNVAVWDLSRKCQFEKNPANDISIVRQYSPDGELMDELRITYTNEVNPFFFLAKMNVSNNLGIVDINPLSRFGYMPSKLISSYTQANKTYTIQYGKDTQGNIISSTVTMIESGQKSSFSRRYEYDNCQ